MIWCLALLVGGCAGDLEQPERFQFLHGDAGPDANAETGASNQPAPPACVTQLFENSCGLSVCHGANTDLDLVSPGVADRLVDKPSSEKLECPDHTLVSSNGGDSLLVQKLTGPDCGEMMPFGSMATEEEIDCVQSWVESMGSSGGQQDGGQ